MRYKNISDCHTHTAFSFDGESAAIDMLNRAKELDLKYYAVTDHCECNEYFTASFKDDAKNSWEFLSSLREEDTGKVKLLKGIELGQPTQDLSAVRDVLNCRNYDIVLGSLHNLRNLPDFYYWDEIHENLDVLIDKYFSELEELVDWGGFDSLTHITYPTRYMRDEKGALVSFDSYVDRMEPIFKKLIEKGIALEINTSGLRQNIGITLPAENIIKIYHEMGGELITIGSDAHNSSDLAKGIDIGFDILKEVGYKYFTIYENRKPKMITIE